MSGASIEATLERYDRRADARLVHAVEPGLATLLEKGDAAIFAVNSRPMKGVRGDYQVKLNHGVSKL